MTCFRPATCRALQPRPLQARQTVRLCEGCWVTCRQGAGPAAPAAPGARLWGLRQHLHRQEVGGCCYRHGPDQGGLHQSLPPHAVSCPAPKPFSGRPAAALSISLQAGTWAFGERRRLTSDAAALPCFHNPPQSVSRGQRRHACFCVAVKYHARASMCCTDHTRAPPVCTKVELWQPSPDAC